jgi:hypothetical protein
MNDEFLIENCQLVYTPTLITAKSVIPAKAEILKWQIILHLKPLLSNARGKYQAYLT